METSEWETYKSELDRIFFKDFSFFRRFLNTIAIRYNRMYVGEYLNDS